ncbi:GNAT family N-acetyltransferase [Cardiobacteriales bacterium ML27]|uniref:GNAT family N-acetyltransferase n=2 Tax=Ostreibacterium oceani TaxID=2654998 RepID=A0A6N7EYI7_9GAMM|nr:GNAT family N-acetyltransferase [Ostreibacterium oceani]
MNITIRKANEADFEPIFALIYELATFEKAAGKVRNSVERMREEQDFFECFVAQKDDGEIVGMALYYFAYYTWVGKSLYLDDLYVKATCRGQKIGTQLLNEIFAVAKKTHCKRVRWQVLHWNQPAIDLYKKCGADIDEAWHNCDFDENGIVQFFV